MSSLFWTLIPISSEDMSFLSTKLQFYILIIFFWVEAISFHSREAIIVYLVPILFHLLNKYLVNEWVDERMFSFLLSLSVFLQSSPLSLYPGSVIISFILNFLLSVFTDSLLRCQPCVTALWRPRGETMKMVRCIHCCCYNFHILLGSRMDTFK